MFKYQHSAATSTTKEKITGPLHTLKLRHSAYISAYNYADQLMRGDIFLLPIQERHSQLTV
jgi:hypothetical protein